MIETPTSTKEQVKAALRAHPGVTRKRIAEITGLSGSRTDPTAMRLWLAGEIEPDSEAGWERALTARSFENVGWTLVDDAERRADVAARAATRQPRNAHPSAEERARDIVEGLQDLVVYRLVQELSKDPASSARAQKRMTQTLRKREAEVRARARQAERDKAADAAFRRVLKQLWEARGAVAAIDEHLIEERGRVAASERRRIADYDWITALNDVRLIITSLGGIWKNVRDLADADEPCPACGAPSVPGERHLRPFAIDAESTEDGGDIVDADVIR